MIDRLLAWLCAASVPYVWRALRWLERRSGAATYALAADRTVHTDLDYRAALLGGPIVRTILTYDGEVVYRDGPKEQQLVLPSQTQTMNVIRHVLNTNTPVVFALEYEGVRYSGVAYPWRSQKSSVPLVVVHAIPPLPQMVDLDTLDERAAEVRGMVETMKRVAAMGHVDSAARAWLEGIGGWHAPTTRSASGL